jgi:hypothetical protein
MSSSGLADILDPSILDNLSKNVLIDETYEFGECENCISDGEDVEQMVDDTKNKSLNRLQIIKIAEEQLSSLERRIFKKKYEQASNVDKQAKGVDDEEEDFDENEEDLDTYDEEEQNEESQEVNSKSIDHELLNENENHDDFIKSVCNDYGKSLRK